MKPEINELIVGLYQSAQHCHGFFRQEAFEKIQNVLPCDSGVWINGRNEPHRTHICYVHGQAPQIFERFAADEAFVKKDMLRNAAIQTLDTAFIDTDICPPEQQENCPDYSHFRDTLNIHHALGIARQDADTQLVSYLGLWRKNSSKTQAFKPAEREALQILHPHLQAADAIWMSLKLTSAYRTQVAKTYAVFDLHGVLRIADTEVASHISVNWPDWKGPDVPPEIFEIAQRAKQNQASQSLIKSHGMTYTVDNYICPLAGLSYKLRVEQDLKLQALSPSEIRVAQHYAQGLTYKEIARVLSLAPGTVRNHALAILRKLGARNKTELAQRLKSPAVIV